MSVTASRRSVLRAPPFALVLFAPACAMSEPGEPARTMMTAQEIAAAGNVGLCDSGAEGVHCHGRAIADPNGCPHPNPAPAGFGPSQLRSAYRIFGSGSSSPLIPTPPPYGHSNA